MTVSYHYYKSKLNSTMSGCNSSEFWEIIWCIRAIQNGREINARDRFEYSPEFVCSEFTSNTYVYPWILEEICNEYAKSRLSGAGNKGRFLQLRRQSNWINLINNFKDFQNAESGKFLRNNSVLDQLPKIAHQQFPWQNGIGNVEYMVRSMWLLSNETCKENLEQNLGMGGECFTECVFVLFVLFSQIPSFSYLNLRDSLADIPIEMSDVEKVLSKVSIASNNLVDECRNLHAGFLQSSFRPSFLRKFPIIHYGEGDRRVFFCPMPEVLFMRCMEGLYYDLSLSSGDIRDGIGRVFEDYTESLVLGYLQEDGFSTRREYAYRYRRNLYHSPDLFIIKDEKVEAIVECKAKRIPLVHKYSNSSADEMPQSGEEISKGIFQLWRYLTHLKSDENSHLSLVDEPLLMLVTDDTWLHLTRGRYASFIARAHDMADQNHAIIPQENRHTVAIVSVDDLSFGLRKTDFEGVKTVGEATCQARFYGYAFSGVLNELDEEVVTRGDKSYPMEASLDDLIPWWCHYSKGDKDS